MNTLIASPSTMPLEERLSRAQEAYRDYHSRCFWFMDEKLILTEGTLPLVIEGLKLHGGHKGWKLAHALCR